MLQLPSISLRWGPYTKTSPEEQTQVVAMVQQALGAGGTGEQLIPKRVAIEKIAPIFGIDNVDAILESLEDEQAEKDERAAEQMKTEADILHSAANDPAGAKPGGSASGGKARGGSASAPAAKPKASE